MNGTLRWVDLGGWIVSGSIGVVGNGMKGDEEVDGRRRRSGEGQGNGIRGVRSATGS